MSRFQRATRKKSRARVALIGPSGSGKTYTALMLAKGLVGPEGRVAVIDTERGSASKYAGSVADFDALDLDKHDPREYVEAIRDAAREGYEALVIDSLSHAWNGRGGALELVDKAAARSKSGNSFTAWRDVTPLHNALIDAILSYPGHVVVTMRAKTEYVLDEGPGGKKTPRKIGLAPVQRDGMEYEFDVVADIDHEHQLVVTKSRCPELSDAVISRPGAELAQTLRAWLDDGEQPVAKPVDAAPEEAPHGAMSALNAIRSVDDMRTWAETYVPAFGRIAKADAKRLWDAFVATGADFELSERDVRAIVDEAKSAAKEAAA